jgi:uncharacterized membrane protein YukC
LSAFANPKVRETMTVEDEVLEELQSYSREIDDLKVSLEQTSQERDKAVKAEAKAIEEKEKTIENSILRMLKKDFSISEIIDLLEVTKAEILTLKNK